MIYWYKVGLKNVCFVCSMVRQKAEKNGVKLYFEIFVSRLDSLNEKPLFLLYMLYFLVSFCNYFIRRLVITLWTFDFKRSCFKVIQLGLVGVFELIRETANQHNFLCCKALQALLHMLQGQSLEGMKNEPSGVLGRLICIVEIAYIFILFCVFSENLFQTLLDLSRLPDDAVASYSDDVDDTIIPSREDEFSQENSKSKNLLLLWYRLGIFFTIKSDSTISFSFRNRKRRNYQIFYCIHVHWRKKLINVLSNFYL